MRKHFYLLIFFLSLLYSGNIYATHLRAGDITATVIDLSTRTYRFTLTLYRDTEGVQQDKATLNFGDGTACQIVGVGKTELVGNQTEKLTYYFTHSFAGDGNYLISFNEENRNANINNIADGNSVNISFYVETLLVVDAFNGKNSTPVLLVPPIDRAATGEIFTHNPGAYDPDGDSLSYTLVASKAYNEGEKCGQGTPFVVPLYKLPNHPKFDGKSKDGGSPLFDLNPDTGTLTWNTPGKAGEYNIAFVVEEWRKIEGEWVRLGYVTRDMQVKVEESTNEPPKLIIPKDTCIIAGTLLKAEITAKDTVGQIVTINRYGGIFASPGTPEYAVFPDGIQGNPVTGTFSWQTNCNHIREKPYQVIFKASDNGVPSLTTFEVWNVTVVAPPPLLTLAQQGDGKTVQLAWDQYQNECSTPLPANTLIHIYRKKGPLNYTPENCEVGIPEGSGYELINTVSAGETEFIDDQNLKRGVQYCYRLVAEFPPIKGGLSLVSNEICTIIDFDVPVITNVTVDSTSQTAGQITVKWVPPADLNTVVFPGPYRYDLFRSSGLTGNQDRTFVGTFGEKDSAVDKNLNTDRLAYNYQIQFYYDNDKLVDASDSASSVRLYAAGGINSINLTWDSRTPWTNTSFDVYRQNKETRQFEFIGNTPTPSFVDDGKLGLNLVPEEEYCYYIKASGTYNNPKIPSPLINFSQIACQSPKDTIAPCSPIVKVALTDCEKFINTNSCLEVEDYFNTITWTDSVAADCKSDIDFYNVYYAMSTDTAKFELVATNVRETTFLHKNNKNLLAGCYAITAVDRSGNESQLSNVVCNDNCPFIEFPNVFTPGSGDNVNTVFKAFDIPPKCPRFVQSIHLIVANRWGNVVYDSEKASAKQEQPGFINWDGRTTSGKELAAGTYYYTAKVKFIALDPKKANQTFKGWVQILK